MYWILRDSEDGTCLQHSYEWGVTRQYARRYATREEAVAAKEPYADSIRIVRVGPKRARVAATLRIDVYAVVERAVEEGTRRGWARAFKYASEDEPGPEVAERVVESVAREVLGSLSEVVQWPEMGEGG